MLIHPVDDGSEAEWRDFLAAQRFGNLVAGGRDRAVSGDWAYVPSDWKVIDGEDPRRGIPTTSYASVQQVGTATIIDAADEVASRMEGVIDD